MNSAPSEHHVGRHHARIHGDLAEVTLVGDVSEEETRLLFALYERVIAEHGRIHFLADISQAGQANVAARRLSVEWGKRNAPHLLISAYGGSRTMRAIMALLFSAVRILGGHPIVTRFSETEAEARRFLHLHRRTPS